MTSNTIVQKLRPAGPAAFCSWPSTNKNASPRSEKQFTRLDEVVANLRRIKANLKRVERLRQTILQQAFSGHLCADEEPGAYHLSTSCPPL